MGQVTVTASTAGESVSASASFVVDALGPRRVWAIQQVSSVANLNTYAAQLADAVATVPAIGGFGVRVPWSLYTPDLLPAGKAMADKHGRAYSFRFMAGVNTPAAVLDSMDAGHIGFSAEGKPFPLPFGADGVPGNPIFEQAYREMLTELAAWSAANGVRLIHCSQYARDWAELAHGLEVRNAPGWTQAAFIEGHRRLITIAREVSDAYPGLVFEFPLSGHGPIGTVSPLLADHMAAEFGPWSRRVVFQGNGWAHNGRWGAADPAVAAQMDGCLTRPVARAFQAIQPWSTPATYDPATDPAPKNPQYDAAQVASALAAADGGDADYLEIYLPTFRSSMGGAVWAEPLAAWVAG